LGRPVRPPASPAHAEQRSKRQHRAQYRNARKPASVSYERKTGTLARRPPRSPGSTASSPKTSLNCSPSCGRVRPAPVRSKLRTRVRGRSALVPRRARKPVVSDRVTAADIIAFIEQTCFVPEGKFVGQRLKLAPISEGADRRDLRQSGGHPSRDHGNSILSSSHFICRCSFLPIWATRRRERTPFCSRRHPYKEAQTHFASTQRIFCGLSD
jgi:hypothetical protein